MKYIDWAIMVLGAWILVSPWVLGFRDIALALWSNIVSGIIIVVLVLWQIFGKKSDQPMP